MITIQSDQMNAWQRDEFLAWMAREFPDYYHHWSPGERDAYVDSRTARAHELGFTRHHHLRFLIGYELGCGVMWTADDTAAPPSAVVVVRILARRDEDPEQRIEAVERCLYGRFADGP